MNRLFILLVALCCISGCKSATTPESANEWQYSGRHVVAFSIENCGQCKADGPQLDQLQSAGIDVVRINADEQPEFAAAYGVSRYPTYLVIEDGEIQSRSASLVVVIGFLKAAYWVASLIL